VRGALEAAGLRVEHVEKILPSLEDVFVSLIEAEDRRQEPKTKSREPRA
jgi:ABC-2 type transport system ATP-binding protein